MLNGLAKSDLLILVGSVIILVFLQFKSLWSDKIDTGDQIQGLQKQTEVRNQNQKQPTFPLVSSQESTHSSLEEIQNTQSSPSAVLNSADKINNNQQYCSSVRPDFCTEECLANPPFICGSDGKSYCTTCKACANLEVDWYVIQDGLCDNLSPKF